MAVKYPGLDCLVRRREAWIRGYLALRLTLVKSLGRVVRSGVHQGLDHEKGRERRTEVSIVEMRMDREEVK